MQIFTLLLLLLWKLLLLLLLLISSSSRLNFDEGEDEEGKEGEGRQEAEGDPDQQVRADILLRWSFWKQNKKIIEILFYNESSLMQLLVDLSSQHGWATFLALRAS